MDKLTQDQRVAKLNTPLGHNVLALSGFSANEGLSELFQISVEAVSEESAIDFDRAIGESCQIEYHIADGKTRWFNGVLTEARAGGQSQDLFGYSLVLRPWFWLLAHRSDCRIFLNKTVLEIIRDVFGRAGFSNEYEARTQEEYSPIPYCVQYRETDFAFVSRVMEENGIYYYFEHIEGHHKLVLADGAGSHGPNPIDPVLAYRKGWRGDGDQCLYDWTSERRFSTGKIELNDYDYVQPSKMLIASRMAGAKYAKGDYEAYDYPGRYVEEARGEQLAKFRLQAEQCLDRRRYCDGYSPSLVPGTLVTVTDHPTGSEMENGSYLLTRCNHRFSGNEYRSSGGQYDVATVYRGAYELLPVDVPFRAFPSTPRPKIYGIQTAKVVGKRGEESEEISTDEYGRIWVQFPWNRDEQISCPVRVAQRWAGQRWGEIFLPRVGMEVVVEYLEGDPDYPLAVGCVYNGDNKVPYDLPSQKTIAGWKSQSTKGGDGYNELIFEDKKGREQIRVHAQNALNVDVLGSETRTIGGDLTTTVGGPTGGGNVTLNAFQTITLNVGPSGSPLTQIVMDTTSITLSVGPGGSLAQIKMDPSGVTISGTPASQLMVQPSGITTVTPMLNFTMGPVTFVSPLVDIPVLNIGVGTIGFAAPIL